jgi:hypothetical protein
VVLVDFAQKLRKRDVLRGRALTRILEKRKQRQQQQDNDDPEGEIAQIGVHRSSFVVARIAALSPWAVSLGLPRGNPRITAYNLGGARVDAKGTTQDYLTHPNAIPGQIMALIPVFSGGG